MDLATESSLHIAATPKARPEWTLIRERAFGNAVSVYQLVSETVDLGGFGTL